MLQRQRRHRTAHPPTSAPHRSAPPYFHRLSSPPSPPPAVGRCRQAAGHQAAIAGTERAHCPLSSKHLENDTARAAAARDLVRVLLLRAAADAGGRALALLRGRLGGAGAGFPLEPADGADDGDKGLVDVDALLGRRLDALRAEALREVAALVGLHLALVLEVALVGDDDDGEVVPVLDAEDLLVERRDLLERGARGDRVNKEEALAWKLALISWLSSSAASEQDSGSLRASRLFSPRAKRRMPGASFHTQRDTTPRRNKSHSPVLMYCSLMAPYSSWPAVSRTSRRATSSSMKHCLRYESSVYRQLNCVHSM